MLTITKVKRNSVGAELGLEKGDQILAFENLPCEDELDYLYYQESTSFTMRVKDKRSGQEREIKVEKAPEDDMGLLFEKSTKIRTCQNRCVFCFVDQMPKGMRESLYVKDDDYSMSFTHGNFVTLTNLCDEGLQRIIRLGLSPLYISVHTTNPELRVKLLRNRFAGKILSQIDALAKGGIEMHAQAVLVPGENDGEELKRTARELFAYYPKVKDLACVPTGITKYRENLTYIPDVDKAYCERLLDTVDELNKEFGVNFLLPADEYFVKAERELKPIEFYGEFEQIENGIGLTTKFLHEANEGLECYLENPPKHPLKKAKKSLLICGVSAYKTLQKIVKDCNEKIPYLQVELLPVVNDFFGATVTCSGLLTGVDIARAVEEYKEKGGCFDELVLPGNTMKEFEDIFLCGMTLSQLKKRIKCKNIRVNRAGGYGFIQLLSTRR